MDFFFEISTEISSDGRSKTLITFRVEGDSIRKVIDQILGSYLLSCMAFSVYEVVRVTNACRKVGLFMFLRPGA